MKILKKGLAPLLIVAGMMCLQSGYAAEEDSAPFPEVVHVEKAENPEGNLAETLSLLDQIGYNPDDAYLYRLHDDAYYHIVAFSDNGDVVQLHDGSKWAVHPSQCYTALYWTQSDAIFIKPRSSCFSSYNYVLQNYTTQEAVEVNLISQPLPMGAYTFHIVNIEPYSRLIQLNDNTVWQVDASDRNFPYWQIGQRLLIGVNNYWRTAPLPNIMINVDLYGEPYSQADFYGYPVGY